MTSTIMPIHIERADYQDGCESVLWNVSVGGMFAAQVRQYAPLVERDGRLLRDPHMVVTCDGRSITVAKWRQALIFVLEAKGYDVPEGWVP